jgi:2-keto-4-pentenoate hydratase/2-oxohepta-3-ene-1,7-dioic acid hydratase in catechol pathway
MTVLEPGGRVVRVEIEARPVWGAVRGDEVFALADGPFGERPVVAGRLGRLDELRLLPPTVPTKIIGVGRNYVAHAEEHDAAVPAEPLLFLKPPSSVVSHGGAIVLPAESERVEHEGELAVVIGRTGRDIAEEDAWRFVLGVTCANDVTARDLQRADPQWTRGKGFDTFCPVGPWLVVGLAESRVADLEVACRVNGELRQQGRTSRMVFSVAQLIAYTSSVMTLEPGDLILTGTPSGVGPLTSGDVVEVAIEEIGVLRNRVEAG